MFTKYMHTINNKLYIGCHSLSDIAKNYQTPLYVFDKKYLEDIMDTYKDNFKSKLFKTDVVYATKAFLVPAILDLANKHGLSVDAVSLGDLSIINQSGFSMEKVVFHGNNKSLEELNYAISIKVGLIVVDNLDEMVNLNNIAKEAKQKVKILFRFNPGINAHTHRYIKTALYESKFGESIYDLQKINDIVKTYQTCDYLEWIGCHSHIGSQIRNYQPFILNIDKMMTFMKQLNEMYNLNLCTLDLGGGFGVDYENEKSSFSIEKLLKKMIKQIEKNNKNLQMNISQVIIEPGRSIVAPAGITLYKCGYLKETYGKKKYLFVDGGMTDNIRPALYQAVYQVDLVDKMENIKNIKVDVAGRCCESGDIITHDSLIPMPTSGDIMVVYNTGAYNYSMFVSYNGQLKPAVVFVDDEIEIASRRETVKDLYKLF